MLDIKLDDYLSEGDKRDIAEDIFRNKISKEIDDENWVRILSNASFKIVSKLVDECFPSKKLENIMAEKVKTIIENLDKFNVFDKPNAWDVKGGNIAHDFLNQCIKENFPKIKETVENSIISETKKSLKTHIQGHIIKAIKQIIKGDK